MTDERKDAAYYETHKDDSDEWGDVAPSGKPRRRLASMFSVRLAPAEADVVRRAAESRGMSVSAFLRSAALAEATHEARGCPVPPLPMTASSAVLAVTIVSGLGGTDIGALGGTARPQFEFDQQVLPA